LKTKVLIIKLGYSETLDHKIADTPSIGDTLRTTPILFAIKEKYPDSFIVWLGAKEAEPLIEGISIIDRVMIWDNFVPFQLMREKFDVLINLEKVPGVCALSDMIDAWVKYGFRFDSAMGTYHAYEKGLQFIEYIKIKQSQNKTIKSWQQVLIEMLDVKWKKQKYLIGYKPEKKEIYDVGLNYNVGSKWKVKAMSKDIWNDLEKRLSGSGLNVSWQKGTNELYDYMDWINSCKIIISQDSLGMHLALAYHKKIIGLFGPTDSSEVYTYGKDSIIIHSGQECDEMPCYSSNCITDLYCMEKIDLDEIMNAVKKLISSS